MRVTVIYLLRTRETPFKGTGVCPGWISYLPLVTVVAGICNSPTLWKWKQIPSPWELPDFMGEYLGSNARPCEGEERGCLVLWLMLSTKQQEVRRSASESFH